MHESAWERDEGAGPKLDGELRSAFGIREEIERRVRSGIWAPGERLTSERDLAEHFETTRVTLREALSMLESEGRLYREDRRGWFVAPPRLVYDPTERGTFDRTARAQGRVPVTRLLDFAVVPCAPRVSALLALPVGLPILRIRRQRFLDGRAVLYVEHHLQPDAFPGLETADLTGSMTEIYERDYGFSYGGMVFEITTVGLHPAAAEPLRMAVGSPGLLVTRAHDDRAGRRVDCDFEYWRHDAILVRVAA
ncbi:UTRA domain-containing protein [Aureimonas pseudogalii]|uniref:DNA-binding GntR family transcriptional regulator n=1 Tax=Aureimonas pseudogalii TaxID=1744844 RepID=A0A7W6E9E0_9HYPH|nr:UTRA domain-containing protein [Aureimonas pseudogalii]MBB3996699.1 DNA-binding GntR family transcriptional regulator [Aureimonas pseudogalii]